MDAFVERLGRFFFPSTVWVFCLDEQGIISLVGNFGMRHRPKSDTEASSPRVADATLL